MGSKMNYYVKKAVLVMLVAVIFATSLNIKVSFAQESVLETKANNTSQYMGIDYSSVYDFSYYISRYRDLQAAFGNNPDAAIKHFVNFGMKEGRRGNASFDLKGYAYRYPDLRRAYGNDYKRYYMHYITFGKREGRSGAPQSVMSKPASAYKGIDYSSVYDYNYYTLKYKDVAKAYGLDDLATLKHFVEHGIKEKRQGKSKNQQTQSIVVKQEDVNISGMKNNFKIAFIADTHISLCDERDRNVMEKASRRYLSFSKGNDYADKTFRDLLNKAVEEKVDLIILGGDIIDSAMFSSIDFVKKELKRTGIPWLYLMGNHDFEYGDEYFSQTAYNVYLPRLDSIRTTRDGYQVKEYDDFIIFLTDDTGNQVSPKATDALRREVKKNKPIILVTHVPFEPINSSELLNATKKIWESPVLIGDNSRVPNANTREFMNIALGKVSPVTIILGGHVHLYHRDIVSGNIKQVTTGAGYSGQMIKLNLFGK